MITIHMDFEITPSLDDFDNWLHLIKKMRNEVIGSNSKKNQIVNQIPRLLEFIKSEDSPLSLKLESAIVLGSLSLGQDHHVIQLYQKNSHLVLMNCISFQLSVIDYKISMEQSSSHSLKAVNPFLQGDEMRLIEACLRCIKSIVSRLEQSRNFIYEKSQMIENLLRLLNSSSKCCLETVPLIISFCCKFKIHQDCFYQKNAIPMIVQLLLSEFYKIKVSALKCLSSLSFNNKNVSFAISICHVGESMMVDYLINMLKKSHTVDLQINAAKCLVFLFRNEVFCVKNCYWIHKVLATLVGICQSDKTWFHRQQAACLIAYLTEDDVALQHEASLSGQLLSTLSDYFNYAINDFDANLLMDLHHGLTLSTTLAGLEELSREFGVNEFEETVQKIEDKNIDEEEMQVVKIEEKNHLSPSPNKEKRLDLCKKNLSSLLKISAFNAYASLAANSESVRKKILESSSILQYIEEGVADQKTSVRNSATKCLVSLSRSVQQLRTNLNHQKIWSPVFKILFSSQDDQSICFCLAFFCNFLLEFSPSKEFIIKQENAENKSENHSSFFLKLLDLTRKNNNNIKLNSIWALMNMTFDMDQKLKKTLIQSLSNDDLFHLIRCNNQEIITKTLATIRNLLTPSTSSSSKQLNLEIVDLLIKMKGREVMESIVFVLESDLPAETKEQALCILTNVSCGNQSKTIIMENSDILRKLLNYLVNDNKNLQLTAANCIYNLISKQSKDFESRRATFVKMQLDKALESVDLLSDPILKERIHKTKDELQS